MASVVGKRVNGRTYYYLVQSGRVDGKPRITGQHYLGTADEIAAAIADREAGAPASTEQLPFGAVAAVWNVLTDLGLAELTDEVVGPRRTQVSPGTYLALAVLRHIVAPQSPDDLATWWTATRAERVVPHRPPLAALSHSRLWRALDLLTAEHLQQLETALSATLSTRHDDVLVVDIPLFTTFTDATGDRLWPLGLGLAVTLDGAIPLLARPYHQGDDHAPTFGDLADEFARRLGRPITTIVDADQNALVNLLPRAGRHCAHPAPGAPGATGPPHSFVGSLPPADYPALLAAPAGHREPVDPGQPGLTAFDTRTQVSGEELRAVLVHSENLQAAHARGLAQDLGQATRRLRELSTALSTAPANGEPRQSRELVAAEVSRIARFRWSERVLSTSLTGSDRLRWRVDTAALSRLHTEHFGKQLLVTSHDDWSVQQIITAFRAKYRVEATLRQWAGPFVAASSPATRWTDQRIAVQTWISVLATTVTHVMRQRAQRAGLNLSVRDLLDQLAGIEETLIRYPSTGGRPRTRRVLTTLDPVQQQLFELYGLGEPSAGTHRSPTAPAPARPPW